MWLARGGVCIVYTTIDHMAQTSERGPLHPDHDGQLRLVNRGEVEIRFCRSTMMMSMGELAMSEWRLETIGMTLLKRESTSLPPVHIVIIKDIELHVWISSSLGSGCM